MTKTLIVDDDARFRRLVKEMLSKESEIEVIGEAEDGQEAILKAREFKPDLVLMDIRMPQQNGLQTTVQLKEEMPDIQVIMLSLYDFDEYREAATVAGASGYILKKFMNVELIPAIKEVFEFHHA